MDRTSFFQFCVDLLMERRRNPQGSPGADGITDEELHLRPPPLLMIELHGGSGRIGKSFDRRDAAIHAVRRKGDSLRRRQTFNPVSYTHLRAHETVLDLVCRLLLEK